MSSPLFAKKPLAQILGEMEGEGRLKRVLGPWGLTALGVGAIIGTGIFVLIGKAAHDQAGPALMLSFVVAGIACIFAALCYAEFAAMVPVAGSAYTYAYATLGELFAWIIGWDLVLEYAVGAATVAHGWSKYFQALLAIFHLHVPTIISTAPFKYEVQEKVSRIVGTGSLFDFPAVAITAVITTILVLGIKESARFNATMVIVKLSVVFLVIALGAFYIDPANWSPFAPKGFAGISFFGVKEWTIGALEDGKPVGMLAGSAMIFFAYIGFDAVSTQSEEAKNPKRDVPFGIIVSLVVCTILYVLVAGVLTGMIRYDLIDKDAPVSNAFMQKGLTWANTVITIGALTGITSVLLVMMLSQPRICLAMARDGLLPRSFFASIHPTFHTPWKSTILTGIFVGTLGALLPIDILAELVNIGTLLAFAIVCGAVLIMRRTNPDAVRPFRVPLMPWTAILGIATCFMLMCSLPVENWLRLFGWLAVGFVIYFGYSRKNSALNLRNIDAADRATAAAAALETGQTSAAAAAGEA
jgi:APA family basic amino acid/polyamine antiporter